MEINITSLEWPVLFAQQMYILIKPQLPIGMTAFYFRNKQPILAENDVNTDDECFA